MSGRMVCTAVLVLALWASTAVAEQARMAVLDLVPVGFDREEAALLSQRLRAEFKAMKRFELVMRDDLYAMVEGKGLEAMDCDDACLEDLGQGLGARWVVSGSIRRRGQEVQIEAQLYDVKRQFAFSQITRKAQYDLERLENREMKRLAEELVPPDEGGGMPWWLLVLGGAGGAVWLAMQSGEGSGDAAGDGNGDPRDPNAPAGSSTGTADIIGTFP